MKDATSLDQLKLLLQPKACLRRALTGGAALAYMLYSYNRHDFYLFAKHGHGTHFHGHAATFLEFSLLFAAVACFVPLFALRDHPLNTLFWLKLRLYASIAGWACCGLGCFYNLFFPLEASLSILAIGLNVLIWLALGVLAAQLGRMPAGYCRINTQYISHHRPGNTTSYGAGIFSLLVLTLLCLMFMAMTAASAASGQLGLTLVMGVLTLGSAAWIVSMFLRMNK